MGRLVEYVVAVGIKRPKVDSTQSPEMIKRYPKDDHKDFPLHPDIVFFCQPEGCTTASKKISLRQINTFVFTLTDKETSITRYGICCNFYRPCLGVPQKRHSKVLRSFSTDEVNSQQSVENIQYEFKHKIEKRQSTPVSKLLRPNRIHTNSMLCYSLTSICIISSYPFFSTFRECIYVLRKLVESRNPSDSNNEEKLPVENITFYDGNQNVNHLPLIECHNWSLLFNCQELNSNKIHSDMVEIDQWIKNLLRIPLPVAGLNRVEVELLPRHVQPPLTFALPEKSRFTFADYPVHLPLELLGVETCLKILTCIMLEHKVVLQSRDYNALSISVMALTALLYPLEYMFPIIPLLPTCMKNAEQLLLAPSPFVIGIPSSFFRIKGISFQVPDDIFIVDLDTNKMSVPMSMDEIPALPEPEGSILKSQLKQCLACLSFSPQPIYDLDKVTHIPIRRSEPFTGSNRTHIIFGNDIDSVDIAVRSALTKFFCSPNVLGNFVQHSRVLRLYPRPVVTLQKEAFVKSRTNESKFIHALSKTQAIEYFAEWMVDPSNTVFRKVQAGILDPRVIGDKPRWYSHYVQPFYYQVHNPHSHLGFELYEDSDSDLTSDEFPGTIKEESNYEFDDGTSCSCCSSYDSECSETFDVINTKEEDDDIIATISQQRQLSRMNSKIQELYDSSYSTVMSEEETIEMQQTILANSVFSTPAFRAEDEDQIVISNNAPSFPADERSSHDNDDEELSVMSSSTDQSSSSTDHSSSKRQTVRSFSSIIGNLKPKLSSKISTGSISSIVSTSSMQTATSTIAEHPIKVDNPRHPFFDRIATDNLTATNVKQQDSPNIEQKVYNSDNQQFLTEVASYVKSGDGVGWLSTKRLRKILIHEGLRQYLINLLDIDDKDNEEILNDVHISRNVYRGYLELLKLLVEGYEHSMSLSGLGRLSSVFQFLEIAHRYYCGKRYHDDSTPPDCEEETQTASQETLLNSSNCSQLRYDTMDMESESSRYYHRDLSNIFEVETGRDSSSSGQNADQRNSGTFVLSHDSMSEASSRRESSTSTSTLSNSIIGEMNAMSVASDEKNVKDEKQKYLVCKSNTSGGFRFNSGVCRKTVFELAGRNVSGTGRRYLFEGLNRKRAMSMWDDMDFWEYCFMDSVSSEREAAGMDVNQVELIQRYKSLSTEEKRLLEEDEDNLLGVLLHNMIAFMLCMDVSKQQIKRKVRRMLGKSHTGLVQTRWIDAVLEDLDKMEGNDVDLLVPKSRQLKIQIFVVHLGENQSGAMFFLEVREDCMVLKSTNGSIIERWWYESVVNMSCSPKTKVLCIWIRSGEETDLQRICTKKCKQLYNSIKASMQKAAERLNRHGAGVNLGGNFTVVDSSTGQQGKLKVSLEGVNIFFVEKKIIIDVRNLKNCCAKDKVLRVEEYLTHDQSIIEHQFFTEEANEICYAILCLFSYVAAAKQSPSNNNNNSGSIVSSESDTGT